MLGRRGFIGGLVGLATGCLAWLRGAHAEPAVATFRHGGTWDCGSSLPFVDEDSDPAAEHTNATCQACGCKWLVKIPQAQGMDRYVYGLCPLCKQEWIGDLGFSGAIQQPPMHLRAAQHYNWDDDGE